MSVVDLPSQGPTDSSDSGSDLTGSASCPPIDPVLFAAGEELDTSRRDDTTDRSGTGERLSAEAHDSVRDAADIGFDRVVDAREAGLGGGLDQAAEAQLGITDEELQKLASET
jgi:hypothetical protein